MHRIAAFARGERVPARIYVLLAAMPLPPGMAARRQTLECHRRPARTSGRGNPAPRRTLAVT